MRDTPRSAFPHFCEIATRWMDNDVYGHLNNVVYYSLFDTAVNTLLIEAGALDLHGGAVIGLVVETHCNFFESLAFPQRVEAGVRVARPAWARSPISKPLSSAWAPRNQRMTTCARPVR